MTESFKKEISTRSKITDLVFGRPDRPMDTVFRIYVGAAPALVVFWSSLLATSDLHQAESLMILGYKIATYFSLPWIGTQALAGIIRTR